LNSGSVDANYGRNVEADAMSMEAMTLFSPRLAERLDRLATKYPAKRSALVPMLLYAQDEVGYLSDAVINEVATRIGISELEVRDVASYYSMLHLKPLGKYKVQVCTSISCMLRGADEVFEQFKKELGLEAGGVTPDGLFSLEKVECIGACSWAPAIQVNYDFQEEVTPALVTGILEAYREKSGVHGDGSLSTGRKSEEETPHA
jgi:NADH-quinone oxidoreductase subunit E